MSRGVLEPFVRLPEGGQEQRAEKWGDGSPVFKKAGRIEECNSKSAGTVYLSTSLVAPRDINMRFLSRLSSIKNGNCASFCTIVSRKISQ
jgi:hypothetical protein